MEITSDDRQRGRWRGRTRDRDWTGGCELAAKRVENDDVTVRFDLSFPTAR